MMRRLRNPRGRQTVRGQMLIVVALMSLLLFGSAALAIDLSSDTHTKRLDQNASDAGALSGARDLNTVVDNTAENQAITDALYAVGLTEGWTATPSIWWSAAFAAGVNGGRQAVETHGTCPGNGCYSVSVKTPVPLADVVAGSLCDPGGVVGSNNCIEVLISNQQSNNFGRFVGMPSATIGSRSVAYHYGPGTGFPVALYAVNGVLSGNSPEVVNGDVYVGSYFQDQSVGGGKAAVCAQSQAGNPQSGHMLFGYPQPPPAGSYPAQAQVPPLVSYGACTAVGLSATAASGACDIGTWDASVGNGVCVVQPALQPPSEPPPVVTAGTLPLCTTIDPAAAPPGAGVYSVTHTNCGGSTADLTINLDNAPNTLQCYSFLLGPGVTVALTTKKNGGIINAYNNPAAGCTASSDPAALNVFWAAPTSVVTISDNGAGCCPDFTLNGSVYMPNMNSTVTTVTNTSITINGQAVVGQWNYQGGSHPGGNVNYIQANTPPVVEILKLVQ